MSAQSIAVDEALLALKIAFIVLLYLFIWRIVRAASRDLRPGSGGTAQAQESVILRPGEAASLGVAPARRARLVVVASPALDTGEEVPINSLPVAIGRGAQNEVPLDGDEFASAQHARFESKRDGLWVEDVGSTNGTFVNGARVTTPRRLEQGDIVRVGQTDFRVET
jgi:FHA domain